MLCQAQIQCSRCNESRASCFHYGWTNLVNSKTIFVKVTEGTVASNIENTQIFTLEHTKCTSTEPSSHPIKTIRHMPGKPKSAAPWSLKSNLHTKSLRHQQNFIGKDIAAAMCGVYSPRGAIPVYLCLPFHQHCVLHFSLIKQKHSMLNNNSDIKHNINMVE